MKFYFCEGCGVRITDADLGDGLGKNKKLKGVYCSQCAVGVSTMDSLPLSDAAAKKLIANEAQRDDDRKPGSKRPRSRTSSRMNVGAVPKRQTSSLDSSRITSTSARAQSRPMANLLLWIGVGVGLAMIGGVALVASTSGKDQTRKSVTRKKKRSARTKLDGTKKTPDSVDPGSKGNATEAPTRNLTPPESNDSQPAHPAPSTMAEEKPVTIDQPTASKTGEAKASTPRDAEEPSKPLPKPRIDPNAIPSLAAYWPLDEGSGLTAVDRSGKVNTGALKNGPSWTIGRNGGALEFDGDDDFVHVPNKAALEPAMLTVALWVWVDGNGSNRDYNMMISKGRKAGHRGCWSYAISLAHGSNKILGSVTVGDMDHKVASTSQIHKENGWVHVAITYDQTNLRLFVNGVEEGSLTCPGSVVYDLKNRDLHLGGWWTGGFRRCFGGLLDDIRIYSRALSAAEVAALTETEGLRVFDGNRDGPQALGKKAAEEAAKRARAKRLLAMEPHLFALAKALQSNDFEAASVAASAIGEDDAWDNAAELSTSAAQVVALLKNEHAERINGLKELAGRTRSVMLPGARKPQLVEIGELKEDALTVRISYEINGEKRTRISAYKLKDLKEETWKSLVPRPEPGNATAWAARAVLLVAPKDASRLEGALPHCTGHTLHPFLEQALKKLKSDETKQAAKPATKKAKRQPSTKKKENPHDWPQWRGGPSRNGVATESPPLLDRWPEGGPPLLWKSEKLPGLPAGGRGNDLGGCGSVTVVDGKAYVYGHFQYLKDKGQVKVTSEMIKRWGWAEGMPDALVQRLEHARRDGRRPRSGQALEAYIQDLINKSGAAQAAPFSEAIRNRLTSGMFRWEHLRKLATVADKEFPNVQDLAKACDISIHHRHSGFEIVVPVTGTGRHIKDSILCLDAGNGKIRWLTEFDGAVGAGRYNGIASGTPAVVDGNCYFAGSAGVYCVSAEDGKEIWRHKTSFTKTSPLVYKGLVYFCMIEGIRAFNAETGKEVWRQPEVSNNVSSASLWESGGRGYVIACSRSFLVCLDAMTGTIMWKLRTTGHFSTPAIEGNIAVTFGGNVSSHRLSPKAGEVICASGDYGDRGGSALVHNGHAYMVGGGHRNAGAHCIDLKTGQVKWTQKYGSEYSSPVMADGKVIAFARPSLRGSYAIVCIRATPEKHELLGILKPESNKSAFNSRSSPTVANGLLYVRLTDAIACYDLRKR